MSAGVLGIVWLAWAKVTRETVRREAHKSHVENSEVRLVEGVLGLGKVMRS